MTSWRLRRGCRIEFICAGSEWHTVSYLIISMINGVIDLITIPYPNMVIFHCCNVIKLKLVDLYCGTLMSRNVTADTILNESFILMTHLASWKPLVRSRYLWSSCIEAITTFYDFLNIYIVVRRHQEDKDASTDKQDNFTLISISMTA